MIGNTEILKLVNPKKENARNNKDIVSQIISCSIDGEEFVVETKYDVVRERNEKYIEPTANNDFEVIEIADYTGIINCLDEQILNDEIIKKEMQKSLSRGEKEELQDIVKTLKDSRDAISEGYEFSIIQMLKDTGLEEVIIEKTKAMQDKFNTLNDIKLIENEVGNIIEHYSNSNDRKRINEAVLTYLEKQKENNIEPSESIKEVQEKLAEAKKENKLAEIADNINEILNTKEHNLKFKKK
ncbi:hypothetical protein ACSNZR_001312 [Campylobacter jejuni]